MDQATPEFGSLVARAWLVDGAKPTRSVAVRLGWILFWTDLKNFETKQHGPLPGDLRAWSKLPSHARHQVPLTRNGSVKICEDAAPVRSRVIRLEYGTEKRSSLELDFKTQEKVFEDWRKALYLMITPWEALVRSSHIQHADEPRILLGRITELDRSSSDAAEKAARWEEWLEGGAERLQVANEHLDAGLQFFENITSAFDISASVASDVLGALPFVGAGFQVLALGMTCTAHIVSVKANEKLEGSIRASMAYIAGLTFTQMLRAVERGDEGNEHLNALSLIMVGLESVVRELDEYIMSNIFKKLLFSDKDTLPKMLSNLDDLKAELREVQAAEDVAELRGRLEFIQDLVGRLESSAKVTNIKLDQIQENQEELRRNVLEIKQRLPVGPAFGQKADSWIQDFSAVPSVPEFVDEKALPSVQKLLEAVLSDSSNRLVGAVDAQGSGGVGKTTACKIVANNKDVQNKFNDGVLWISLGIESTAEDILEELLEILKISGGVTVANEMRIVGSKNMEKLIKKASTWFITRKVLIVVDNVWEMNWVSLFRSLVGVESCLLFSTRVGHIGDTEKMTKVEFGIVEDFSAATSIFNKHLELPEVDERYNMDIRDRIIRKCKGLPLALGTAARLVRRFHYEWEEIDGELEKALITANIDAGVGHPGLGTIIGLTLAKLDSKGFGGWLVSMTSCESWKYSWAEMYCALAVLPKSSASIPVPMLGLLWNMGQREAKQAVRVFCDLALGSMAGKDVFKLHDLQLQYCSYRCSRAGACNETSWHERLVRSFPCLLGAHVESSSGQEKDIINSLIADLESSACQDYLVDNAVRHIIMAQDKLGLLLRHLLTEYRWIRKKAGRRSLVSVAADYDLVLNSVRMSGKDRPSDDGGLESASTFSEESEGYKAIRDALRKIPYDASPGAAYRKSKKDSCAVHGEQGQRHPDSGLASQLLGRLAFKYGFFSSKKGVESPKVASEPLERVKKNRGIRHAIANCFGRCGCGEPDPYNQGEDAPGADEQENQAFDSVHPGNSVVTELLSSVELHAKGPWLCPLTDVFGRTKSKSERKIPVGGGEVLSVALSKDGMYVYSGSEDGIVRRHDLSSGECANMLPGHTLWVRSVAVATDASESSIEQIVSASDDETIRVWNVPSMDCVAILRGHTDWVRSVDISKDGKRLVSCSDDKTVRVWDREEDGSWTSQKLVGHTSSVFSVALSENGLEIASASSDKTIRLWRETSRGSAENKGLFEHVQSFSAEERVASVIFASREDNAEVIFRLYDREGMYVWDRDPSKTARIIGRGSHVHSLATSSGPEGQMVVGGCWDGVRVWRIDTGALVYSSTGENATRSSVKITRDKQRIICGCSDSGTIEVWPVSIYSPQEGILRSKTTIVTERNVVTNVVVSEDKGRVATLHNYQKIQIWDVGSGSRVCVIESAFVILDLAISMDGATIVTSDERGQIVLWNADSGQMRSAWKSGVSLCRSIALSRNGKFVAVAGDKEIDGPVVLICRVWNVQEQQLAMEYVDNNTDAVGGLTSFVEERGLDQEAYPVAKLEGLHSFGDLSLFSSDYAVHVIRAKPSSPGMKKHSGKGCSCVASALFDVDIQNAAMLMLPYVRGLDARGESAKPGLGMVAVAVSSGPGFEILVVLE